MKNKLLKSLLAATALISVSAMAEDQANQSTTSSIGASSSELRHSRSGYLGGLIGANIPNNQNVSTNANYGVTAGALLTPGTALGIYGTYYRQGNSLVPGRTSDTATRNYNIAGELNFLFSVLHVGGDAGIAYTTWSNDFGDTSLETSNTMFVFGPELGFDVPLGSTIFTVGAEVHYLLNTEDAPRNFQALAALKAWL